MIKLKRVYEPPARSDGRRFLVERLWPRGLTKEAAQLTEWLRDLAPSDRLRRWYGHDPAKWPEFKRRYRTELRAPERQALLARLAAAAGTGTITLVYAARDTERNSAIVVHKELEHITAAA